ncbi:glycosyltransferase family 2 protein [Advenella kashmirensis]|uniref:glycosyltransferase family 2 protein n=1 Tax=Advenella kashmirensis TaxID=310575 RepID=UPI0005546AAB|nr:glycosyltransferase [Advenella kashmirensis]
MTNDQYTVTKKITVVVLTYNRSHELRRTLMQLSALPEQPPIIVVNNGSSDTTARLVSRDFPEVKLISLAKNWGAAGRNVGVDLVKTPYVAFCDDDTWWTPRSLEIAVDILDYHPEIAVLNARILVGEDKKLDPSCSTMEESPLGFWKDVGPLLTGFMAGANVMRTSAYIQADGYWDAFFIGGEESLIAMDILNCGGKIVYAPELVVRHLPSKQRDNKLRQRLIARNAIWTCWLRLPWRLAWSRSKEILGQISDRQLRRRALFDALLGFNKIVSERRVLNRDTCELLRRVWQKE